MQYARIVRFTDVTPERIAEIVARIEDRDGPPPGVDATGMELFFDQDQGTALFVGYFDSEEKLRAANEALDAMDAGDTPGTRASVDGGAIKAQRHLGGG
jgi:hypothetical protein